MKIILRLFDHISGAVTNWIAANYKLEDLRLGRNYNTTCAVF